MERPDGNAGIWKVLPTVCWPHGGEDHVLSYGHLEGVVLSERCGWTERAEDLLGISNVPGPCEHDSLG